MYFGFVYFIPSSVSSAFFFCLFHWLLLFFFFSFYVQHMSLYCYFLSFSPLRFMAFTLLLIFSCFTHFPLCAFISLPLLSRRSDLFVFSRFRLFRLFIRIFIRIIICTFIRFSPSPLPSLSLQHEYKCVHFTYVFPCNFHIFSHFHPERSGKFPRV